MTDPDAPKPDAQDELDELASAVLDGEATTEERARAADDPAVAGRVEELRAVSDAVGDVPALDD